MIQIGKNWFKRQTKSTSPHYWYNRKIRSHLYLYRTSKSLRPSEYKWEVLVINKITKEKKELGKFKTKSPAIEFMENWMRENQD